MKSKSERLALPVLSFVLTVFIVTSGLVSSGYFADARPNFGPSDLGQKCAAIYDTIRKIREQSDRQGGLLPQKQQELFDKLVASYNRDCRPTFGGNPRIDTSAPPPTSGGDQVADPGTGQNSQPSPPTGTFPGGDIFTPPGDQAADPGTDQNPQPPTGTFPGGDVTAPPTGEVANPNTGQTPGGGTGKPDIGSTGPDVGQVKPNPPSDDGGGGVVG